jgi:hypothetical protein
MLEALGPMEPLAPMERRRRANREGLQAAKSFDGDSVAIWKRGGNPSAEKVGGDRR